MNKSRLLPVLGSIIRTSSPTARSLRSVGPMNAPGNVVSDKLLHQGRPVSFQEPSKSLAEQLGLIPEPSPIDQRSSLLVELIGNLHLDPFHFV